MNELNLLFGPYLPPTIETIGLSFIAAPTLATDTSIAVLSAERYVRENYAHLHSFPIYTGTIGDVINVTFYSDVTTISGTVYSGPLRNEASTITLEDGTWNLQSLHSPIKIVGVKKKGSLWAPVIQPGTVWRAHIVQENEPSDSWLLRSGLVAGDSVYLIYTVPELTYGTTVPGSGSSTFPGSELPLKARSEVVNVQTPTQIVYTGDLKVITQISVNGIIKFPISGETYDGTAINSYIRKLDTEKKIIILQDSLRDTDTVEVSFLESNLTYDYTGFRTYDNTWYSFDANPEFGHFIADKEKMALRNSSDCLLEQATIYLIPSAYVKAVVVTDTSTGATIPITINLTFVSAYNYGETHFVRHLIGQDEQNISVRQQDGPVNSWGYAVFGKNYYDEPTSFPDDIFSNVVPSMMPLGKIVLAAPAAVKSISLADVRQRGGGVPEDFPIGRVASTGDGLDTLRGYNDMGTWEGKAIKKGGVVEIQIDPSILDNYTITEIQEIVASQIPPGIDYLIKFVSLGE